MYSLIKIKSIPELQIEHIKDLTADESNKILNGLSCASDFIKINNKVDLITSAIKEFDDNRDMDSGVKMQRAIIEVLSLFYMYIETIKVVVNKDFGAKSSQMDDFILATKKEFDSSFSYRFLSKLRNYVIHYAFPAYEVTKHNTGIIEVKIKKENLNLDSSVWGKVLTEDFKSDKDEFEIGSMFKELYSSIMKISTVCVNFYDITKLKNGCVYILGYQEMIAEGEFLHIGKLVFNGDKLSGFSEMSQFPFEIFQSIINRINKH